MFLVLPLTTPEIVMGSSLLTLFLELGLRAGVRHGRDRPRAVLRQLRGADRRARIRGFDWTLEDAALDLGASPWRTFRKVTFPLILPGIIAAALLSFALSLDDFIITFFNAGSTVDLPAPVSSTPR